MRTDTFYATASMMFVQQIHFCQSLIQQIESNREWSHWSYVSDISKSYTRYWCFLLRSYARREV